MNQTIVILEIKCKYFESAKVNRVFYINNLLTLDDRKSFK